LCRAAILGSSPRQTHIKPAQSADDAIPAEFLESPPGTAEMCAEIVQLALAARQFPLEAGLACSQKIDRLDPAKDDSL
jgi:hypothetical protein